MGDLLTLPTSRPEAWVGKQQIAEQLGVTTRTVERWIKENGLPAHKLGAHRNGRLRFLLSEVDEWFRGRFA